MRLIRFLIMMAGAFGIASPASSYAEVDKDFLILESFNAKQVPRVIKGNYQLARAQVSAASTFKTLLSWAALEEGLITPETRWEVGDRHVPNTPREINLHQAMYYSSNDYFITLAKKVGKEKLTAYIQKSRLFPEPIAEDWIGEEWRPVIKGGSLLTTPMKNHLFMRNLAFGKLTSSNKVKKDLFSVLEWPAEHPMVRLYGKTGVWGGAVWYNGFGVKQLHRRVITVFFKGGIERRPQAIGAFYGQWALIWSPTQNTFVE
ncbi:MAG: penicillin-binding transpeptidase domain-containing protein [Verrucomicrobiota bacterium]